MSHPNWSNDLQQVSDTALCLCQAVSSIISYLLTNSKWVGLFLCQVVWSIMSHPMTNSEWVTLLFFFARLNLINYVSSHAQQEVGGTALFLCQAVSSIVSLHMTNRGWVTLLSFLTRQSHQSHLMTIGSEWYSFIFTKQPHQLCLIMTNSWSVTQLYFFARQSHQLCLIPWPPESEWYCFISLPCSLTNHGSSNAQQRVSDTTVFLCQAESHQSCLIAWPTAREWQCFISFLGWVLSFVSHHDQ